MAHLYLTLLEVVVYWIFLKYSMILFEDISISPKDDQIRKMTLNAKIEKIEEMQSFKIL